VRVLVPARIPVFALIAIFSFAAAALAQQRPSLELLEGKASATQTAINVVGQVKNVAGKDLSGITVYCDFQNASGKTIKSEEGKLETDPLKPNGTSEFKCSTKSSPDVRGFGFRFVSLFGGPLAVKDVRKK
jgi:hypothetical protein